MREGLGLHTWSLFRAKDDVQRFMEIGSCRTNLPATHLMQIWLASPNTLKIAVSTLISAKIENVTTKIVAKPLIYREFTLGDDGAEYHHAMNFCGKLKRLRCYIDDCAERFPSSSVGTESNYDLPTIGSVEVATEVKVRFSKEGIAKVLLDHEIPWNKCMDIVNELAQ